jgi:hypothetical protein
MPNVLRLDPHDAKLGLLTPFLAQRVERYTHTYQPEVVAAEYASAVMAKLWLGDPSILALGIVDPESAALLGHALAVVERFGSRVRVEITQLQADQNVGDARYQALEHVFGWAKEQGIEEILLFTNRDGKEFESKAGFKRLRTVHRYRPPSAPEGEVHA